MASYDQTYRIIVDGVPQTVTREEYNKHMNSLFPTANHTLPSNSIDTLYDGGDDKQTVLLAEDRVAYLGDANLTDEEIKIFSEAKAANPKYVAALLKSAKIIPQRVGKYSGKTDPYTNFKIMLSMLGLYFKHKYNIDIDMRDVFMFYRILKVARLIVSGSKDFADDSAVDGRVDEINYGAIDLGDMLE